MCARIRRWNCLPSRKLPKAKVLQALENAGLDQRARPEQLTLQDYCALQSAMAAIDNGT